MKKTKKVRTHTINGTYVLSKSKKLKESRSEFVILDVTIKDIERLYLYSKQRGQILKKKYDMDRYVVRLSTDVAFLVDNKGKK